jgi:hypothetical protein
MKTVTLTNGQVALLDDGDYDLVKNLTWVAHKPKRSHTTYAKAQFVRNSHIYRFLMHVLIARPQKGEKVDHADGNGLNNQRYNLRPCTHQENLRNRRISIHSSAYKGVCWHKERNKWRASITVDRGIHKFLGNFTSEVEAALAYNDAAMKYFGQYARLNPVTRIV